MSAFLSISGQHQELHSYVQVLSPYTCKVCLKGSRAMRIIQLFLTSAILILATSTAMMAERLKTITHAEVAASHCSAEWARLEPLKPDAWRGLKPNKIDPNIDAATTEAFNRYSTAIIALADYSGSFVGFANATNHNPTYLALAKAKYDLAICLMPTEQERDLILELARTTIDASDREIRAALFKAFDQFDCMQIAKASEVIFGLDLSSQPLTIDFAAITSANMKACNS